MNITELAVEMKRQVNTRKDYIADMLAVSMTHEHGNDFRINGLNGSTYGIRDVAHQQIGEMYNIPRNYYEKMKAEEPGLLTHNVNTWNQKQTNKRLVRVLDGDVRAVLSTKYRPLDNYDLGNAVLPVIYSKGATVISCGLTESKLYIKTILPSLTAEITSKTVGDIVQGGCIISNSEVGRGALSIEPFIYRIVCGNGMVMKKSFGKHHIGARINNDVDVSEFLRTETQVISDKALWMQVQDVVNAMYNKEYFDKEVEKLNNATKDTILSKDYKKVIDVTAKYTGIPGAHTGSILERLIEGADLTRYGLSQAFTATAHTVENYDVQTELEIAGGKVIDISPEQWRKITH